MDIPTFLGAMFGTRAIEIAAALCGLVNVGLIIRRSLWNYPFGLVMVAIYAWVFFEAKLYSDVLLQVFFFVIQIFGLVWWLRGRTPSGDLIVRDLSNGQSALVLALAALGILGLGGGMALFTDAALPFWDAAIAVLSVIAQTLLARRFRETWAFWIVVDVIAIGVYLAKDLYPTALLYLLFLGLATAGLLEWRRAWRRQEGCQ